MKQAVVTQAIPGSATTQDYLDGTFSSDVKAALFLITGATATDTATAHGRIGIGITDFTNHRVVSESSQNGLVATNVTACNTRSGVASCIALVETNTSTFTVQATASSQATGARASFSDIDAAQLCSALLLGGSDIEVSVVSIPLTTGSDTNLDVAHGLSGEPDAYIVFNTGFSTGTQADGRVSMGFATRSGSTYTHASTTFESDGALTLGNSGVYAYVSDAYCGGRLTATSWHHGVTLSQSATPATTFYASASATLATASTWYCLCIKGVTAKCGVATLPTGTGSTALVTGMSVAPSVLLTLPTRITTVNSVLQNDDAGFFGLGLAVNNSTQCTAGGVSSDDNATTTNEKSYLNSAKALVTRSTTGTEVYSATVNSWDAGGVTLNYSAVAGTGTLAPYLAFGTQAAPVAGTPTMGRCIYILP